MTHLLEWEDIVAMPSAGKDEKQWNLLCVAGGNVNRHIHSENSLAILYKVNNIFTSDTTITFLGICLKDLPSHKNLYTKIHSSSKLEQHSLLSVGEWLSKLWYIMTAEYCSRAKRNY